jgi:hypothetical protein
MVVEEGDRRGGRRWRDHLTGEGEDAAGRSIPIGGEVETSPKTVTARLTAASPVKVRPGT